MKTFLILLCLPLLSACRPPDIRLKRLVTAGEVVGTWQLDPKNAKFETNSGVQDYFMDPSKPHEIIFRPDGTCRYRSVLQMATPRYVDADGKWSIVPPSDDPKGSEIQLAIDFEGTALLSLDAKEESGRLVLWEFWNPDRWTFLEYKRKDTEQAAAPNGP